MYIRTLGHFSEDEGKYQSEDAARRAADDVFKIYEASCRGVDVPKRLTRPEAQPGGRSYAATEKNQGTAEVISRQGRAGPARAHMARQPGNRVFSDPVAERWRIEEFVRRTGALSPDAYRIELAKLLVKLGYPPDYLLRDLDTELRRARCEDSLNALRFAFPCGGMEVDDPEGVSRQVADHYMQTELGSAQVDQRAACRISFGRSGFCNVRYAGGIIIRVNFSKVPYALIAVQVAPKLGPACEYRYSCFGRKVNLSLAATP